MGDVIVYTGANNYVLFSRLMHFLHIRPVDEEVLKELMPEGWYPEKVSSSSEASQVYDRAVKTMSKQIKCTIQFLFFYCTNLRQLKHDSAFL